jgi:hypothetical protein
MRKFLIVIVVLCVVKLLIHFLANGNYGFHRDELLHLSVSEHLSWGFMEFPPFIAVVGKLSHLLFDYSLFGVRLFPTLAGMSILVLCCLMAKEMGGDLKSILLSGVCFLAFLPFYRNHTLFQPVAFDQLFWMLGFYFLIRYINTNHHQYLLLLGITSGVALMNKYTFLVWGLGLVVGLIFFERGRVFRERWLYIAGAIALIVVLPNVIWQYQHNFPILIHHAKLSEIQLSQQDVSKFGIDQLKYPFTLAISLIGLFALFKDENLKRYCSIGISVITIFIVMWIMRSKPYYFFGAYPVLFAVGAVRVVQLFRYKWIWTDVVVGVLILTTIPFIPDLTPILPVEQHVKWSQREVRPDGRVILTNDYADMFGWEEQVKLVDSVYRSLSDEDRKRCVIWAQNYGEAGAIKILGHKYGLPDPICVHGSFWLWGAGDKKGDVCISIGNEESSINRVFGEKILVRMIHHKYAIEEEQNIPVYICREPLIDLRETWPRLEKYVF